MFKRSLSLATALAVAALASAAPPPRPRAAESELPSTERLAAVRDYIKKSWSTLSRSLRDLPAAARHNVRVGQIKKPLLSNFPEVDGQLAQFDFGEGFLRHLRSKRFFYLLQILFA